MPISMARIAFRQALHGCFRKTGQFGDGTVWGRVAFCYKNMIQPC